MTTKTIIRAGIGGVLVLIAGAGIACSSKADASSFDSAYCHVVRKMVVNDFKPPAEDDPNPSKTGWLSYMAFMDDGLRTAPAAIHADWVAYHAAVAAQGPIVAKFGYDEDRFNAEATDADKAVMNLPSKVEAGKDRILKYESVNCGSGQPPAVKVSFKGSKPRAYCDAVAADNKRNESIELGDPASLRHFLTDPKLKAESRATDALFIALAPKVIRDDVKAEVKWWNSKQKPTMAKYGYDMTKLFLHGSERDVQAVQLTDKKIAEHYARALGFEQQVCGL